VEAARTRAEYFSIDTTVDRLATELERLPRRK
jgi:hypothetical protein